MTSQTDLVPGMLTSFYACHLKQICPDKKAIKKVHAKVVAALLNFVFNDDCQSFDLKLHIRIKNLRIYLLSVNITI